MAYDIIIFDIILLFQFSLFFDSQQFPVSEVDIILKVEKLYKFLICLTSSVVSLTPRDSLES